MFKTFPLSWKLLRKWTMKFADDQKDKGIASRVLYHQLNEQETEEGLANTPINNTYVVGPTHAKKGTNKEGNEVAAIRATQTSFNFPNKTSKGGWSTAGTKGSNMRRCFSCGSTAHLASQCSQPSEKYMAYQKGKHVSKDSEKGKKGFGKPKGESKGKGKEHATWFQNRYTPQHEEVIEWNLNEDKPGSDQNNQTIRNESQSPHDRQIPSEHIPNDTLMIQNSETTCEITDNPLPDEPWADMDDRWNMFTEGYVDEWKEWAEPNSFGFISALQSC